MKHHKYGPSRLDRIAACPASAHVVVEDFEDEVKSEACLSGTRIHAYLAGQAGLDTLSDEEQGLAALCQKYEKIYTSDEPMVLREQELHLMTAEFDVLTEGTADVVVVREDDVLIIDWKTGRKKVQATSSQLVAYGAAAMQTYGKPMANVHIYMPRYDSGTSVMLTDFDEARCQIAAIVAAGEATSPAFIAGEHCTWCAINASCTACRALQSRATGISTDVTPKKVGDMAEQAKVAKKICDQIIARCEELTMAGEDTGWFMKPKRGNRFIPNVQKVLTENKDLITKEELLALTKVSMSDLEALIKSKLEAQWLEKEELKKQIEERLDKVTERGPDSQTMIRKKNNG